MRRRVDELRWHCGPHPCVHVEVAAPPAWRYALVGRDMAFSLTISQEGAILSLHRSTLLVAEEAARKQGAPAPEQVACDLLPGGVCVHDAAVAVLDGSAFATPALSVGMRFWAAHAVQGLRDQPPKFWRALEREARKAMNETRLDKYKHGLCPRCHGDGIVRLKKRPKAKRA